MAEQKTKNGGGAGKKKREETPVTVTLVLKVHMECLCLGCPEKIIKCVKGFKGVVKARIEANKLTVVGKKIDPSKLMETIFKETKKKVDLISPHPEKEKDGKNNPPKKPPVTTSVLSNKKIHRVTSTSKGVHEMSVGSVTVKAPSESAMIPVKKDNGDKKEASGFRNPRHPKHEMELKKYVKPYTCDGCKESGFGPRYRCEECDFDLHPECMFPKTSPFSHEFFPSSTLEFLTTPPPKASHPPCKRRCRACRMDINGYVYHCKKYNWDLHPCCADLKKTYHIKVKEGGEMVFNLHKNVQGECMWCQKKSIKDGDYSNGWSYISECRNSNSKYHVHVACVTQMILEEWKQRKVDSDNYNRTLAVEKVKVKAMQPRGRSRGGTRNKFWRILEVLMEAIVSIVVGSLDPTGLVFVGYQFVKLMWK